MPEQNTERTIHIRMADDLHRRLRRRCAELDTTIQNFVVELLDRELSGVAPRRVHQDPRRTRQAAGSAGLVEGHAHPVHRPAASTAPGQTEVRLYDYVDHVVPMLIKTFEKRLRGDRAIGYARDEAPLGLREIEDEAAVEYDEEVLRGLDDDP